MSNTYEKQGYDVIKETAHRESLLDLRQLADRLQRLKVSIESWPTKVTPDAQTLELWNHHVMIMRDPDINQAREILRMFKEIYDAGQLPEKWVKPLQEFNQWLKEVE